jgi:hypothetical protein
LRILLTIENARERAGSKQYVHALASAYAEEGHEVIVGSLAPDMGSMGEDIQAIPGVHLNAIHSVAQAYEGWPPPFDLGIIAPAKCFDPVHHLCKQTIQITHGVVEPEAPLEAADFNVFVSEEARDHWGIDGPVIRNPIDTNRYAPAGPPRSKLTTVAHFSNYDDIKNLQVACHYLGVRLVRVKHQPYPEVIKRLTDADMIFAVGRSAYEAMSMGREVVFCDNRAYYGDYESLGDGLASQVYGFAREFNCSGRWAKHDWTVEDFIGILGDYDERSGQANRRVIIDEHDHRNIADELLEVASL